jgi:hypothetical protein
MILLIALIVAVIALGWLLSVMPSSKCTGDCNQGRSCNCGKY